MSPDRSSPDIYSLGRVAPLAAALFSMAAAATHIVVLGDHYDEWWLYGLFFAAAAWAQIIWALWVVYQPSALLYQAGAIGNAAIIGMWALSRTVGIPLGPSAGDVEDATPVDILATSLEWLIVLLCFGLLVASRENLGRRLSQAQVWVGLAVVCLALIPLSTAGLIDAELGGGHGHGTGMIVAEPEAHLDNSATSTSDPTLLALTQIVREKGTEQALARLEELAAADRNILAQTHALTHGIARFSFTHYGGAREAFAHCLSVFEQACYHGVVEGYLQSKPELKPEDIAALCDTVIDTTQSAFIKFQCVHGLGHGLTLYFNHDIFQPLSYCDFLETDWNRESCYGGVFMENIVFAAHPKHTDSSAHESFLKPEDPLYPCNNVKEKYQGACYFLQSSAILMFNGYDVANAFEKCGTAPEKYIPICYQSMGRDISGITLRDNAKSIQLCQLGATQYRSHCYYAVAKQFIDVAGRTEQAFTFCREVPEDSKSMCYTAIGEMVATLYSDQASKAGECAKAEKQYEDACAIGAQLLRPG